MRVAVVPLDKETRTLRVQSPADMGVVDLKLGAASKQELDVGMPHILGHCGSVPRTARTRLVVVAMRQV
jgi:hypothetical protein